MRYSIQDLLDGLKAQHAESILNAEKAVKDADEVFRRYQAQERAAHGRLPALQVYLAGLVGNGTVSHRDLDALRDMANEIRKDLPAPWKELNAVDNLNNARSTLDKLLSTTAEDLGLYQFLEAVRASGETHVSQSAMDKAKVPFGFKESLYSIMSALGRSRKAADDAERAR